MSSPLHELGLSSDVLLWEAVFLTALSFAVGVLGGFVGLALGSIRLPFLLLLGLPAITAAGTNIIVSAASAGTGSVRHLREGRVDRRLVLYIGVPSVVGGFLGGFYSHQAPDGLFLFVVGVLLAWQGIEFTARSLVQRDQPDQNGARADSSAAAMWFRRHRKVVEVSAGLGIGVLGGAVGLILGGTRLPILIRLLQVDPRIAAGSNAVIGFMLGVMGFAGHVSRGNVDYTLVVLMGTTAMIGGYFGAKYTGQVSKRNLVLTMGVVLTVMGAAMVWRAFSG